MSIVRPRRNPIMGSLVTADVVLKGGSDQNSASSQIADFKREILKMCHESLAAHKIPATIRCVPALEMTAAGKLVRHDA